MTFMQFFASYWWLMFPVFGMFMAIMGMFQSEQRTTKTMDLIKSYVDQGKDPPPELLKLAAQDTENNSSQSAGENRAWSFIVFTALAAGLGTGYYFVQAEDWAFAFLIGAVIMGVMAAGALLLLVLSRKG